MEGDDEWRVEELYIVTVFSLLLLPDLGPTCPGKQGFSGQF